MNANGVPYNLISNNVLCSLKIEKGIYVSFYWMGQKDFD